MVIHNNSFRRYTPPTCTLEIYHPQPFWGRWSSQPFPLLFSFQLHFDDPRLPQEERTSIVGDRNLLERLRDNLSHYVDEYLGNQNIEGEELSCQIQVKDQDEPEDVIYLSRESIYSHRLFYQSFQPHPETIEVILTNTQLLDLVNALEDYHWDATRVKTKRQKRPLSIGVRITLTAIVCSVGSFLWWQYGREGNRQFTEQDDNPNVENSQNNIQEVIPPSPLDQDKIPKIVSLKVPPSLKNQKNFPPPPPTLTQPPQVLPTPENSGLTQTQSSFFIPSTSGEETSSASTSSGNGDNSPIAFAPSNQLQPQPNIDKSVIARLDALPEISRSDEQVEVNPETGNSENVAINSPPSNNINPEESVSKSNQNPDLRKKFEELNTSVYAQKTSQNISQEVEEYFSPKWQPPEDLPQSIEYRLRLKNDGTLVKVTPVGQIAAIFIDKTPLPVIGEEITSSFTEEDSLNVRLILRSNGDVETFTEIL